jgi:hypothetical protein
MWAKSFQTKTRCSVIILCPYELAGPTQQLQSASKRWRELRDVTTNLRCCFRRRQLLQLHEVSQYFLCCFTMIIGNSSNTTNCNTLTVRTSSREPKACNEISRNIPQLCWTLSIVRYCCIYLLSYIFLSTLSFFVSDILPFCISLFHCLPLFISIEYFYLCFSFFILHSFFLVFLPSYISFFLSCLLPPILPHIFFLSFFRYTEDNLLLANKLQRNKTIVIFREVVSVLNLNKRKPVKMFCWKIYTENSHQVTNANRQFRITSVKQKVRFYSEN